MHATSWSSMPCWQPLSCCAASSQRSHRSCLTRSGRRVTRTLVIVKPDVCGILGACTGCMRSSPKPSGPCFSHTVCRTWHHTPRRQVVPVQADPQHTAPLAALQKDIQALNASAAEDPQNEGIQVCGWCGCALRLGVECSGLPAPMHGCLDAGTHLHHVWTWGYRAQLILGPLIHCVSRGSARPPSRPCTGPQGLPR